MKSIHDLAKIEANKTDKQFKDHSYQGLNYLHYYERHFEPLREKSIRLLEIGVFGGCSTRLWRDYFIRGDIHGLDINPACHGANGNRIKIHIGDQSQPNVLMEVAKAGPFDIIIDDGSHYVPHMLTTFEHLWPHVTPRGWYVFEDMRLSYEGVDVAWPGMHLNTTPFTGAHRDQIDCLLQKLIWDLDNFAGSVLSVHLYPMVYFIQKT